MTDISVTTDPVISCNRYFGHDRSGDWFQTEKSVATDSETGHDRFFGFEQNSKTNFSVTAELGDRKSGFGTEKSVVTHLQICHDRKIGSNPSPNRS